jgi:hypothetical protein
MAIFLWIEFPDQDRYKEPGRMLWCHEYSMIRHVGLIGRETESSKVAVFPPHMSRAVNPIVMGVDR